MTFYERYSSEDDWFGKVIIMEIYHLTMCNRSKDHTLRNTSDYFGTSMGLVSENLKLANEIHKNPKLIEIDTRQEALRKIK